MPISLSLDFDPKTLPSRKRRSATLSDHSQTSGYRCQLFYAYITTPKTLLSRKRRSATLPDHSQTSRIPVPISLSLDVDPKDPPESKASVCDTIRPLADFQDTGVNYFKHIFRLLRPSPTRPLADFQDSGGNKLKLRFRLSRPSRIESIGLRQYQTTRRLPGFSSEFMELFYLYASPVPHSDSSHPTKWLFDTFR